MDGLIMDYQLNVPAILRRAEQHFGHKEIVSRLPDKSFHRFTYADLLERTKRLAAALRGLGLGEGDRVGTFAWNHHEHLEAYLGVPAGGMVVHTLNLRLHPDDLTYIASHAGDKALIVDKVLWPLVEQFAGRAGFEHVIAVGPGETPPGAIDYEELLASAEPGRHLRGRRRASRGGDVLHERHHRPAEGRPLLAPRDRDPLARLDADRHARPRARRTSCCRSCRCSTRTRGASPSRARWSARSQVFPGPHLDPPSLLDAFVQEERDGHRRRADDLDGDPAGARREPRRLGPLAPAGDDRRRLGGAAGDDRRASRSGTACTSRTRGE